VVAILGTAFLLVAFAHVVQGAVEQGRLPHKADARYADATWRCNALRGNGSRESCQAQLGPVR